MTINIDYKLALLQDSASDDKNFEQLLGKLLEASLSQQRRGLRQYERDL